MDRFRGQASPKTWLYRINVNLCRDKLSAWSARKIFFLGEDFLGAPDLKAKLQTRLEAAEREAPRAD